jgi:membrane protease YdiL (CAAX protease family)
MESQPLETTAEASPNRTRFAPWSTPIFALAWAVVTLEGWGTRIEVDPIAWLYEPAATAGRVVSRDVELADAARAGELARPLRDYLHGDREDALAGGIALHSELIGLADERSAEGEAEPEWQAQALAQLGILLAAEGSTADARLIFERLGHRHSAGLGLMATYGDPLEQGADPGSDQAIFESLEEIGLEGWFMDEPMLRLLERRGEQAAANELQLHALERGRTWQARVEALALASAAMVGIGAGALALGGIRRGPRSLLATPPGGAPPWSLENGIGVLFRGDFWNRLYFVVLNGLSVYLPGARWLDSLYDWGSIFASLPLLWLAWRHLLQPATGSLRGLFSLGPPGSRLAGLIGITFAAAALNLAFGHALSWGFWTLGFEGHWAEGIDETLIWGEGFDALRTSLDYVVWTPLIEEFTFRGLLFFSLRRRLGPWSAAILSAAIFSALHFYSLPGFASTFCGGFIWAVVFEKSRSLLPGIAIHALYNLLYVMGMVLVYR